VLSGTDEIERSLKKLGDRDLKRTAQRRQYL